MALNFFLLLTLVFHQLPSRSLADAPGTLALFLDEECEQASVVNPSVKLPVDTCLVNAGALGIAVQSLPPCASGVAALIMYHDTSCANQIQSDLQYNNCFFDGPNGIPAVLFACSAVAGGAVATATSTVTAGSSTIPVAANTPAPSSSVSTPSSNGANVVSTSSASHTSSVPSPTSTNSAGAGSGGGLSQSTQIALGVALPVGGILVALFAWWFPCRKR